MISKEEQPTKSPSSEFLSCGSWDPKEELAVLAEVSMMKEDLAGDFEGEVLVPGR